jgi:hypothetical protein
VSHPKRRNSSRCISGTRFPEHKVATMKKDLRKNGGKQNIMSNIAAFAFGAMMAYTPSLIVLAFVLWNTPPIYDDVADLN